MGIPSQIFNGIAKAIERFLDERAPVLLIKGIAKFLPVIRIAQFLTGRGERKGPLTVQLLQTGEKLPFEFIPQDTDRNKKPLF